MSYLHALLASTFSLAPEHERRAFLQHDLDDFLDTLRAEKAVLDRKALLDNRQELFAIVERRTLVRDDKERVCFVLSEALLESAYDPVKKGLVCVLPTTDDWVLFGLCLEEFSEQMKIPIYVKT